MKPAISAALLSIALAAPLVAQSTPTSNSDAPSTPGVHAGGPHGPHGYGHSVPGMARHRVEAIANSPFTAQFTDSGNFTNRQGQQEQRTSTSNVYRDSQGRVREEVTLPAPLPRTPAATDNGVPPAPPAAPRGPRTMVIILDPVAHTVTHLDAERQTAYVQAVPADFFTHMQQREDRIASGQQPQHSHDNATTTSLGSKVIAGTSATGEQTTVTFPARDGGAAHTITRQNWFAMDLKLEVSSTETSDRGTHSDTLTSINKAEPNPSLFQVPAGYTTTDAPDGPFAGHHRGGPGAPGETGGDGTPPPPPSM